MKKPLLQIKNLSVVFAGGVQAVDDVSFDVGRGTFTALVGESGSGKSVTALSITRLIRPEHVSGQILLGSLNLMTLSGEEIRKIRGGKIAYIFQDPGSSLNPVLTIGDQLIETRRAHFKEKEVEIRERAFRMLSSVRLCEAERVFRSYPHELSGGMRQRAMIAMALMTEPEFLIADEATTALDPVTQEEILQLLASFKKEKNLSILFITHDLVLAKRYADEIVVMKKGKIEPENGEYAKKLFRAGVLSGKPKSLIEV